MSLGTIAIYEKSPDWLASGHRLVYFAQRATDQAIKIGFSQRPRNRQIALKGEFQCEVTILGVLPGGRPEERELHARFKAYHIGGEWHKPAPELLDFIERFTFRLEVIRLRPIYPPRPKEERPKCKGKHCYNSAREGVDYCGKHLPRPQRVTEFTDFEALPQEMNLTEVQTWLQVSRGVLNGLITRGELPAQQGQKGRYINKVDLMRLMGLTKESTQ